MTTDTPKRLIDAELTRLQNDAESSGQLGEEASAILRTLASVPDSADIEFGMAGRAKTKATAAASTPAQSGLVEGDENLRMDGYYIGFGKTGVKLIDRILSAVACAGKAFHHTECWTDETPAYEEVFRGKSPNDWIQCAANDAADLIRAISRAPSQPAPVVDDPSDAVAADCEKQATILEKFILDGDEASELLRVQNALRCAAAVIRHKLSASPQPDRESERISMPRKVSHQMAVAIIAALDAGEPEKFAGQAPEKALQPIWDAAVKAVEAQS